jgi:hypothetical protein
VKKTAHTVRKMLDLPGDRKHGRGDRQVMVAGHGTEGASRPLCGGPFPVTFPAQQVSPFGNPHPVSGWLERDLLTDSSNGQPSWKGEMNGTIKTCLECDTSPVTFLLGLPECRGR